MKTPSIDIMQDDTEKIVANLGADDKRFSGKTIRLSGGAGFLGRHFIDMFRYLNKEVLSKPCKVISADNYITGEQSVDGSARRDPYVIEVWADVSYPLPVRED